MSMRDLISGEAEIDEEENDESFDEDGEPKTSKARAGAEMDDSSEEEEDDDDEEAARAVCRTGYKAVSLYSTNVLRSVKASL